MDLTTKIGIAVSGCKNGYALLATDNIDAHSELLKNTLRDQRGCLRIMEPRHDFFTMTVHSQALVLSACRSSVDSVGSSGGFISVSIFVPVYIHVKDAATLLLDMLDNYWAEYIHPIFGSPLPGKFESAEHLRDVLKAHVGCFSLASLRYKVFPSQAQQPPMYYEYTDIREVNAVMDNPWHKMYAAASELIFIPKGLLYSDKVRYDGEPRKFIPQRTLPNTAVGLLKVPAGAQLTVKNLMVDSISYTDTQRVSMDEGSQISYTLCLPTGKELNYSGTMRDALQRRLIHREGDFFELAVPLMEVELNIKGVKPARECTYALSNGNGNIYSGKSTPAGTYLFKIPAKGFPYSLVEAKGGNVKRTLAFDALTPTRLSAGIVEVTAMPGLHGVGKKKKKMPMPVLVAGGILGVAVIALAVWLLCFPSTQEEPLPEQPVQTQSAQPQTSGVSHNTETGNPGQVDYCYIVIPVETSREIRGGRFDYVGLRGDILPSGAARCFDAKTKLEIIRLTKAPDYRIDFNKGFYFVDNEGNNVGTEVKFNKNNLPDGGFEDLKKFPNNTQKVYVLVPSKAQITAEDYEKWQAYNPSEINTQDFTPLLTSFEPYDDEEYQEDEVIPTPEVQPTTPQQTQREPRKSPQDEKKPQQKQPQPKQQSKKTESAHNPGNKGKVTPTSNKQQTETHTSGRAR